MARVNKEEAERSADSFRQARDQADENAKRAEVNEARAYRAQARAQIQESISLADQSLRQTANGDVLGAMHTALAALPRDPANLDRPYVARADYALAKAFLANRPQAAIKPSNDWVNDVVYNRDGSQFALGTRDGFFKTYDAKTNQEVTSGNERRRAVMAIAASADGSRLVVAYQDPPSLVVKDGASGKVMRVLRLRALPNKVLLTRDGSRAVVLSQQLEGRPAIIDLNDESGNVRFVEGHPSLGVGLPRAAAISPDGRLLLFVRDNAVLAWDLSTGSLVVSSVGARSGVRRLELPGAEGNEPIDGAAFVSDTGDAVLVGKQHVYLVDLNTATVKSSQPFEKSSEYVSSRGPLLTPSGDKITFPVSKRNLATYSRSDWSLIAKRELPADIAEMAISPDGTLIAAACADFSVRAWPIDSADPIGVFLGHNERVRGITFSPDGRHMITYGDAVARVWDVRASGAVLDVQPPSQRIKSINLQSKVATVEASTDTKAAGDDPGTGLWSVLDRKPVGSEAVKAFVRDGAAPGPFSPSGRWLAIKREYSGDSGEARKDASKILTDLAREVAADAAAIELGEGRARAVAIIDSQSGKATRLLVTRGEARSFDVKFLGDDGATLGLAAVDYNGDDSRSFAEIWNAKSGKELLSVTQDGRDARLLYVPESGCTIFVTQPRWREYTSSVWNLSNGERIAGFDRPVAPYDDESAAARLTERDRVLLGDSDNRPSLVQCSTGKEIGSIAGAAVGASRLLMSTDRRRMLVDSIGAPRTLWNLDAAEKIATIPDGEFEGSLAQFSDDNRRIVTREWRDKKRGSRYSTLRTAA
ncbi:WD40 repeat domain-containing protein [Bradyrhizobium sp. 2S1]|uniref:WD40 repeat domain-containing protein n=1 Tax=Bradyrhizobium sp. 2S1 TaxID=1404429 RepID=UPI0014095C0C|nr:WD40 repeat domain-containing protein [Bradyrhizobium sp. 2S1]MCK7672505.1 hypothetical protein [Bradyrhizobium sp. 2S1]